MKPALLKDILKVLCCLKSETQILQHDMVPSVTWLLHTFPAFYLTCYLRYLNIEFFAIFQMCQAIQLFGLLFTLFSLPGMPFLHPHTCRAPAQCHFLPCQVTSIFIMLPLNLVPWSFYCFICLYDFLYWAKLLKGMGFFQLYSLVPNTASVHPRLEFCELFL